MSRDDETIFAEANRWHAAACADEAIDSVMDSAMDLAMDSAMDWDAFTLWLEADPRHLAAYDAVALADALLDEHRDALRHGAVAANDDDDEEDSAVLFAPAPGRWRRWMTPALGSALAASLVAVLALPGLLSAPEQTYQTQGLSRTITLADGSSVTLAPHSRLTVSGKDAQEMALNGGAWFAIRHDPSRALEISAGGVQIDDIGTRFDVQEAAGQVRVAVAEGEVRVSSAALSAPLRLVQGRALVYDARGGSALVRPINPERVGEWRSGRLSFDAMPLALVAADLSRYAGVKVTVAQGLRDRQFSGTLVVGDGEAALRDLSQLMGTGLRRGPDGFVLGE